MDANTLVAGKVKDVFLVIRRLRQPRLTQGFPVTDVIDDSSCAMRCRLGRSL